MSTGQASASSSAPAGSTGPAVPAQLGSRAAGAGSGGGGAWTSRAAWITLFVVIALSLVIDLWSKVVAFERVADKPVTVEREHVLEVARNDPRMVTSLIPQHEPVVVIPELLHFTLVLNPGAVFGIGPGKRFFFVGFTLFALAFGLGMFSFWTGPRDRAAHIGIGLLIGGGLGNLYDRLVYGCVRDFLHPLPGWKWPNGWKPLGSEEIWPYVSNVADLFLLIGIAMLMVHLWRRDKQAARAQRANSQSRTVAS